MEREHKKGWRAKRYAVHDVAVFGVMDVDVSIIRQVEARHGNSKFLYLARVQRVMLLLQGAYEIV